MKYLYKIRYKKLSDNEKFFAREYITGSEDEALEKFRKEMVREGLSDYEICEVIPIKRINPRLSDTQKEVVKVMKEKGGKLIRWSGGFWTFDGAKGEDHYGLNGELLYRLPEWHCGTNTVKALAKKYVVTIINDDRGMPKMAFLNNEVVEDLDLTN